MKSPWSYDNNTLSFDKVPLETLAKELSTPFYVYTAKGIKQNYLTFSEAASKAGLPSPLVCFALKSNANLELLKVLAAAGAGADIVSGGELHQALKAGIPAEKIVFSGVGKKAKEMEDALLAGDEGIYSFNIESIEELEELEQLAKKHNRIARVAFRLNPKVAAKTHKHISTGYKTHKFGILEEDIYQAVETFHKSPYVKIKGLSTHIGSQLTCMEATSEAVKRAATVYKNMAEKWNLSLEFLDVGGGLGIDYSPQDREIFTTPNSYMEKIQLAISSVLNELPRIVFEPGRVISARSGALITRVIRRKSSENHKFVIVDGGMNDFVRTSLYEAYHEILPGVLREGKEVVDIVGPICETADCFAHQREISPLKKGDLIAVADAGAYGFTMASLYNMRDLPKECIVLEDGTWKITD